MRSKLLAAVSWLVLLLLGNLCIADVTTIIVVRHAERASGSGDVSLTQDGIVRSHELSRLANIFGVSAVYCTDTLRSRQTASPTAQNVDLLLYDEPTRRWANQIINRHAGTAILIVGHSNTIPQIVRHFGGGNVVIYDKEFDNVFILRVDNTHTQMVRMRYGETAIDSPSDSIVSEDAPDFSTNDNLVDVEDVMTVSERAQRLFADDSSPIATIARNLAPQLDRTQDELLLTLHSEDWTTKRQILGQESDYAKNVNSLLKKGMLANNLQDRLQRAVGPNFIIGDPIANQDTTDQFFTTVYVGRDNSSAVCTGVVVAPNVVLTAKHCTVTTPDYIYTANSLFPPNRSAYIDIEGAVIRHPTLDLALLKLSRDVSFEHAELADENSLESFEYVTVAGYGFSAELSAESRSGYGQGIRRRVTVPIRSYVTSDNDAARFSAKLDCEFVAGGTLAGAACYGDSGGPAYVLTPDGWKVLGITSGGIPPNLWQDPGKACGNGSKTVRCEATAIRKWITDGIASLINE